MVETLLILVLIFLIFRLLSGWTVRFLLRRQARHTQHSPFEQESAAGANRKKIFKKEDGEYVDFEEIKPNNPND